MAMDPDTRAEFTKSHELLEKLFSKSDEQTKAFNDHAFKDQEALNSINNTLEVMIVQRKNHERESEQRVNQVRRDMEIGDKVALVQIEDHKNVHRAQRKLVTAVALLILGAIITTVISSWWQSSSSNDKIDKVLEYIQKTNGEPNPASPE